MTDAEILDYVLSHIRSGDYAESGEFRLVMDCPLPECRGAARKSRHWYLNREWYGWRCYRTGRGGSLRDEALSRPGVWSEVVSSGLSAGSRGPRKAPGLLRDLGLVPLADAAGKAPDGQIRASYRYLEGRGVTARQITDYRLCVRPFEARVWFPYWLPDGRVPFAAGRRTDSDDPPKTVELGDGDKPLYGSHVSPPHGGLVVLVEGWADHFATPRSYALMGSDLTRSQVEDLTAWASGGRLDRILLVCDPDAKDKARHLVGRLRRAVPASAALFLEGCGGADPDKLGRGVMGEIVRQVEALPAWEIAATPHLTASVRRP